MARESYSRQRRAAGDPRRSPASLDEWFMRRIPAAGWLNLALKFTIVVLVIYGAAHKTLPQYADKGMGYRLVVTPAALAIVPVWWWLKGKPRPYPSIPDMLLVAPFFVDILGLTFGLYGTTTWFDRFAHFTGWFGMTGAFGVFFSGFGISRRNTFLLTFGLGAITHILWEVFEFVSVLNSAFGMAGDYVDTMEDLIISLAGSACGALLASTVLHDQDLLPADMIPQRPEIVAARRKMR